MLSLIEAVALVDSMPIEGDGKSLQTALAAYQEAFYVWDRGYGDIGKFSPDPEDRFKSNCEGRFSNVKAVIATIASDVAHGPTRVRQLELISRASDSAKELCQSLGSTAFVYTLIGNHLSAVKSADSESSGNSQAWGPAYMLELSKKSVAGDYEKLARMELPHDDVIARQQAWSFAEEALSKLSR